MNTKGPIKEVTLDSDIAQDIITELSHRAETLKKREELSQESFHDWFCETLKIIANGLGFAIANIAEITMDFAYSFKEGFREGVNKAKKNSYRYRMQHKD